MTTALRRGDTLYARWLDRINRRYDELHSTMQVLMKLGVKVHCTLNGMMFDGATEDPIAKATRDAVLAFMAAQGEVDYVNRKKMQRRGIEVAKAEGRYMGRPKLVDDRAVAAWRAETGASIKQTAEHFESARAALRERSEAGRVFSPPPLNDLCHTAQRLLATSCEIAYTLQMCKNGVLAVAN